MNRIKKILLLMLILVLPYHFQVISVYMSDLSALKLWKEAVIGILALITFVQIVTGKKKFGMTTAEYFAAAFVIIVFVYVCFSSSMYHALYISRIYFVPLLLIPVIKYTDITDEDIALALKLSMINSMILCCWGIFQAQVLGDEFLINMGYQTKRVHHALKLKNEFYMLGGGYMQRVTSTFAAPNTYGMYITIFITIVLFTYRRFKINKIFAWSAIILSGVTLVLTYSRTSWVGCAVVFIFYLFTNVARERRMIVIKSCLIVLLIGVLYVMADKMFIKSNAVSAFTTLIYNTCTGKDSSMAGHLQSWIESIENMFRHPLGLGLGKNGPRAKLFTENPNLTESSYFLMEYEVGIFGALIYFGIYAGIIYDNIKLYKESGKKYVLVITAVVVAMLLGFLSLPFVQDFELAVLFCAVTSVQYCKTVIDRTDGGLYAGNIVGRRSGHKIKERGK